MSTAVQEIFVAGIISQEKLLKSICLWNHFLNSLYNLILSVYNWLYSGIGKAQEIDEGYVSKTGIQAIRGINICLFLIYLQGWIAS